MMVWKYLWAFPVTVVGLAFAALALRGGRARVVDGVLETHGPWLKALLAARVPFGGAAAVTLGHVVIGQDDDALRWSRSHERVHVRQCERWGAAFLPAYFLASIWAVCCGGHYYLDNAFEREAFERGDRDLTLGSARADPVSAARRRGART